MKNVQRKLRNGEFENAISLLRAARYVSSVSKIGCIDSSVPFPA